MSNTAPEPVRNRLIDALPRKERNSLLQRYQPVELMPGAILCEPGQPFRQAYFPLTSCIALLASTGNHQVLEIGLVGNEGMLGATLALGINVAPYRAVVQSAGSAVQISAAQLRRELRDSSSLLRTLKRYLFILMTQLSQIAVCTHFHEIEPRLARGLLMAHDRAHANHFHLTHELLANRLGVRRSGITIAAGSLQQQHLISYSRGEIRILDRGGLEAAACECYTAAIRNYTQLFT